MVILSKKQLKPQAAAAPLPAALISCGGLKGEKNIITLSWVGMVNSEPPMLSISVRPSRYSYQLIKETKEFVVNIPSAGQAEVVDACGLISGKKVDKFAKFNLTAERGSLQYAPLIAQCPISIECKLGPSLSLKSHELFVGEIVAVWASEEIITRGKVDYTKLSVLGYANGQYLRAKGLEFVFGFSARKKN